MTEDEELLCRTENRDLFDAWQTGVITFGEAAYIGRRDEFLKGVLGLGMPHALVPCAGWVYDQLFERSALARQQ